MADIESGGKRTEQVLTMLDRVVQFRWALLLVSFFLAADIALSFFLNQSILNFAPTAEHGAQGRAPQISIGNYITFVTVYFFFMAGISPFFQYCTEWLFWQLRTSTFGYWLFPYDTYESMKPRDRYYYKLVRRSEAETKALTEKDSFWIARITALSAESRKQRTDNELHAHISFACTLLLLTSYVTATSNSIGTCINSWLAGMTVTHRIISHAIALVSIALICAPWFVNLLRREVDYEWIEHPELAQQKLHEMDKHMQEQRELAKYDMSGEHLR